MFQLPQISPETRAAARLASGQPIWLNHDGRYCWLLAAEGALPNSLPGVGGQLFITAERAHHLGGPVETPIAMLKLPPRADTLAALINPLRIGSSELLKDFEVKSVAATHPATQAMFLIKQTGLLPAFILGPQLGEPPVDALMYDVSVAPVVSLTRISQAALPLRAAPNARALTFRDQNAATHLAIIVGNPKLNEAPLVRLHSSCLTGDILGSLRCDCGDQLYAALTMMHEGEGGVLLYLDQEGRGIGLANKLRAYQLQDGGMDTYAANNALGFADDERDFSLAAALLREISVGTVRLLTNNPKKVKQLETAGITVAARVPLVVDSNTHNAGYLAAKVTKGGHVMEND